MSDHSVWNYRACDSGPFELAEPLTEAVTEADKPWACIVWDDPVNLMSYVTYVFMSYFHFSKENRSS